MTDINKVDLPFVHTLNDDYQNAYQENFLHKSLCHRNCNATWSMTSYISVSLE